MVTQPLQLPIQPVEQPILCNPYEEPTRHWVYNPDSGEAYEAPGRRPASFWYRYARGSGPEASMMTRPMFFEEERDELLLVNRLRADVKRWRASGYEAATPITKELLRWWHREDRPRRLFFCQLEAVETIIYLVEILGSGKGPRFKPEFTRDDLAALVDTPADGTLASLVRYGCKMATGSGKTVVMAMIIAWSFANRGQVPSDERFPAAALIVCPNLTVKERLQVLRTDHAGNYFEVFDIVPTKLRPLVQTGKVLITNWHQFAPESEHAEGGKTYAVVNKGPESDEAYARRVLGDLFDRGPIMVLNDEGHHAYRPAPSETREEQAAAKAAKAENDEATVWVTGLDRMNAGCGIRFCVDLSATPFYIAGSGHPEGTPFPWLVSDFGLVDAIESGIVKIPRLPVSDSTGRPEPRYFRLYKNITDNLQPAEKLSNKKPKPEVVYREAEAALLTLAGQWVKRFEQMEAATPGQERVPPVLIIVCDNTDIAEVLYRNISGEETIEVVMEDAAIEDEVEEADEAPARKRKKPKTQVTYGRGKIFPEYFSNTQARKHTIRIDSRLLEQAESEQPGESRQAEAERLRRVVATVGKPGEPGEQVRCVVSVGMLTEGWDANNVTNIFGLRAFSSQLLAEQVVGRGLRRIDYTPDPETGLLTEEYVDVYGIPFSVIPFKGRTTDAAQPEDRPKQHVRALPERAVFEIRFPLVEGYAFALKKNSIRADVSRIEALALQPEMEPTAVFVKPTVGYQTGTATGQGPGEFEEQDREAFYRTTHLQQIEFEIARQVVAVLVGDSASYHGRGGNPDVRRLGRQQLFPQVLRLVKAYIGERVEFRGIDPRELGHERYLRRIVDRLVAAIEPDDAEGEPPLMPILNRYTPHGSTAHVDFKTTKPCYPTQRSHINQIPADTRTWEQSAAFRLEQARDVVDFYARNEGLDFVIPYAYLGVEHNYEPDFLVRMTDGTTVILEIKGHLTDEDRQKHEVAKRWVKAVNNWGGCGKWDFHVCRDPQQLAGDLRKLFLPKSQAAD